MLLFGLQLIVILKSRLDLHMTNHTILQNLKFKNASKYSLYIIITSILIVPAQVDGSAV